MVLRILTERRSHHASYRKIKTGRAKLAFVIAIGVKVYRLRLIAGGSEDISEHPVDLRVAAGLFL